MNVGVSSKPNFVISVDKIDKENFVLTILDLSTLATVIYSFSFHIFLLSNIEIRVFPSEVQKRSMAISQI